MNRFSSIITFARNSFSNLTATKEVCCALRISSSQLSTHTNTSIVGKEALKTRRFNNVFLSSSLIRSNILPITATKIDLIQPNQFVRDFWSRASYRVGRGPRGNNGKRSPRTIQGAFQCHPHKKRFKKTLSRRFPGHVDVFNRQGERFISNGLNFY